MQKSIYNSYKKVLNKYSMNIPRRLFYLSIKTTLVFLSLLFVILLSQTNSVSAACSSGQTLCSDGHTCVDFQSDCPPLPTNTPVIPTITPTPQPQCSASCRRTETAYETCGAGSCSSTERRTGKVYDYKQTWNGTCTDIKCPNAVADICTTDTSCGGSGGNTPTPTSTGNPPTATPTPTSVPPTPTPTIVLLPPAALVGPPVCDNNGWSAKFQWTKSPSVEATDYVFRSEYPDNPTPLWLVFDSTDIWKSTKNIQQSVAYLQNDLAITRNVFPNSLYQNWSIETIAGDNYTANGAHRLTSTQGFKCKPLRAANPENCTLACEPNIGVWKEEYTYTSTYKSQDLNGDNVIDIVDFEKIRALKYAPTSTPTLTPTPMPQVQINVKDQQGQPVAIHMYRLQCMTDSGHDQCSDSFLQSQGVNSCRHDLRNTSASTLTFDIQSSVCKAGAGIQYNPSNYTIVGVTGVPERSQEYTYTSATAQEKNVVWDKNTWTTGKRTIDIIVKPVTP